MPVSRESVPRLVDPYEAVTATTSAARTAQSVLLAYAIATLILSSRR